MSILSQVSQDFKLVLETKERVNPRLKNARGRVTQKKCVEEVLDECGLDTPIADVCDLASQSYGRRITLGCALQHKYAIFIERGIIKPSDLVQAKDAKGRILASAVKPMSLVEIRGSWQCGVPVGRLVTVKEVAQVQGLIRLTFKNPDAYGEVQVYLKPTERVLAF